MDLDKKNTIVQTKNKIACEYCGKTFSKKYNLTRHVNNGRCKNKSTDSETDINKGIHIIGKKRSGSGNPIAQQMASSLMSVLQEQNKKIDKLAKIVQDKQDVTIEQQQVIEQQNIHHNTHTTHNTHNNTQYVTIYVTEKVDFVEILTNRFGGDREKAINYLKEKINNKVDGDVDLFCDIYLNGPKETWSCICQDKKNYVFQLRDANNNVINDPGGVQLYKNFRMNYINALLYLSSLELRRVIDFKVGTDEFAERRDYLMDEFDIGLVQNKMFSLSQGNPDPFIKKVVKRIDMLEKAFSLSFQNNLVLNQFSLQMAQQNKISLNTT